MVKKSVFLRIRFLLAAISIVFAIACMALLPQTAAVHWNNNWQPNGYLSKHIVILLVLAIEALLLWLYSASEKAYKVKALPSASWLYVAYNFLFIALCLTGPVVEILMLFLN